MRITCRIFPIVYLLFCFVSCSKKDNAKTPGSGDETGGGGGTGGSTVCATTKADAESIAIFPSDNAWHQDISGVPVDPYSSQILGAYSGTGVKADFGSGLYEGNIIGIPFVVVCNSQPKIAVTFRGNAYDDNYGNESDPGPYPIPLNAPIEPGDGHVIAVDKDNSKLYELYNADVKENHWEASSGAVFDLKSNALRTDGWTSAGSCWKIKFISY